MRILHMLATLSPESGGPAIAAVEMARATAALGHQVTIFTTNFVPSGGQDPTLLGESVNSGVTIRYFPVWRPHFWRPSPALAATVRREIAQFDVLHLHSLYLFHSWLGAATAHRHGIPYIIRPHGTLDPYILARNRWQKWILNGLFQRRALHHAAAVHFTTDEERRLAAPAIGATPGFVVPLGVGDDAFQPMPSAEPFFAQWPATRYRKILLFLGRLHAKKGLDLLIGAFAPLAAADENLHLVIAGPDDGVLARTQSAVAAAGLGNRVTFTGMLSGQLKWSAFAAAQLFVLPSYSENFGISVVEALASGLPVVISDQVNIWHEISDRGVGRVTECDIGSLTAALSQAFAEDLTRRRLADQARQVATELYSWPIIAKKLESMYATVIANAKARPS